MMQISSMQISSAGIDLIKKHEGCKLKAYPDPGTGGKPWTIGYGSTTGVSPGMTITQAQADQRLAQDLSPVENAITVLVAVPLNQGQFDCLCSLIFNIGVGAFSKSTLLKLLNEGKYDAVPAELRKWVRGGGKVLPGLVARRDDEAALWQSSTPAKPTFWQVVRGLFGR